MAFQFPWTNLHELNLDWFLSKFKQFTDNFLGTTATAESVPYGTQPSVTVTGGELDEDTDVTDPFTFNFKIPAGQPGAQGEQGVPGVPGQDGFSPTASVTKSGDTAIITITDKNGTTTATVTDAGAEFDTVLTRLENYDGTVFIDDSNFDIGNITMSNTGWTYGNSNSRVRTKQGITYTLAPGDVIKLSSYTNARFYVGWLDESGNYSYQGWNTSDFIAPVVGQYVILLCNLTDTNLNGNMYPLLNLLQIIKADNTKTLIDDSTQNTHNLLSVENPTKINTGNPVLLVNFGQNVTFPNGVVISFDCVGVSLNALNAGVFNLVEADGTNHYCTGNDIYIINDTKIPVSNFTGRAYTRVATYRQSITFQRAYVYYNTSRFTSGIAKNFMMEEGRVPSDYVPAKSLIDDIARETAKNTDAFTFKRSFVTGINHRGFNDNAPENTIPAFKLSKLHGFDYVETDIQFTSDGIPVCIHDTAINRTARNADGSAISGTVNITNITYATALTYDFGVWFSSIYAGTKIPSFEQFILLCRNIGLKPYVEIKTESAPTETQIRELVDIVNKYGMSKHVTWMSYSPNYLETIVTYQDTARVGYLVNSFVANTISTALNLKTPSNEVFIDCDYTNLTQTNVNDCITANIPLEVYVVDYESVATALDPYITGVISNILLVDNTLYNSAMS